MPEELRKILLDPQRAALDNAMAGLSQDFSDADFLPAELRDAILSPNRAAMDDLTMGLYGAPDETLDKWIVKRLNPTPKRPNYRGFNPQWR